VLDDVHLLRDTECRAALSVLAEHVPPGSRLVLAGRDRPPLRIARLRAEGKLTEIGPGELALTPAEAAALLRAAEVRLGEDEVAELYRRTEGWPAGLYLAALSLRVGGTPEQAVAAFGGDDRFVAEYVESELLAWLSPAQRAFLTRTAVLERMCGPLCEAVLELPGSGAMLAELARSNLLLVPLDRRGQWYRHHHLFRDMLLAGLERLEPGMIPVLRRRATAWCLRNDLAEEALEYSIAAGDVDTVARLVEELFLPVYRQARITTVQRWIGWLEDRGGIEDRPVFAVHAASLTINMGRPA
jgi:LuxR family maltose regulon positive regulatory protein